MLSFPVQWPVKANGGYTITDIAFHGSTKTFMATINKLIKSRKKHILKLSNLIF